MKTDSVPQETAESKTPTTNGPTPLTKRIEIACWLLAIGLGFFHIGSEPHYLVNNDAMSYLDIAEGYLRKDWAAVVNGYWNPLYSWLLALALWIFKPSPYWKFATLHLVNFVIYLATLGCFAFFVRELVRHLCTKRNGSHTNDVVSLPDWALVLLGYLLFIWSSLFLITISVESPDMLVAAFVYLASGIILRIRRQPSSWFWFLILGTVLGLGYLSKSVMFPMTLVFLVTATIASGSLRRALPRVFLTLIIFVLLSGPWILAISRNKGRFTMGDSGKLNYLWNSKKVAFPHWQGEEPGAGTPKHPTRKIFDSPPAWEFGHPVAGTYPIWYDASYWYAGSVNHFNFTHQVKIFARAGKAYYELFHKWGLQYGMLVGLLSLYLLGRSGRELLRDLLRQWSLIIPALGGFAVYALVTVQERYVGSFLVLFWLGLFSAVRLPNRVSTEKIMRSITIVLAICIMFTTIASSTREVSQTFRQLVTRGKASPHEQWEVAEGLREFGLVHGDRVALIGNGFRAFWAHLAGVRIIAEIHRDRVTDFWEAEPQVRADVIKAFAATGAKALIAEKPPTGFDLSGWQRIRDTQYYVYKLNP